MPFLKVYLNSFGTTIALKLDVIEKDTCLFTVCHEFSTKFEGAKEDAWKAIASMAKRFQIHLISLNCSAGMISSSYELDIQHEEQLVAAAQYLGQGPDYGIELIAIWKKTQAPPDQYISFWITEIKDATETYKDALWPKLEIETS
jgi:hypothetical protein